MRAVLIAFTAVSVGTLCGCAMQPKPMPVDHVRAAMVGKPKKDVLACMGTPVKQDSTYPFEFLTYKPGDDVPKETGILSKLSPQEDCVAVVVIDDGLVKDINYQNAEGYMLSEGGRCSAMFQKCRKH